MDCTRDKYLVFTCMVKAFQSAVSLSLTHPFSFRMYLTQIFFLIPISDIKQEKEDGLVLPKQQTETTGHDATSLSIDCNKSLETKVFLNGHHKLKDVFENNEEDRNGNTLVDARLKDDGEDGEVSHSLRNNCKLQLSKVRVEQFCKVNPEVEESKLANESNDLSISDKGNLNDEITYDTTDFISERDDNIGNEMVQNEVILGGGEGDVEDGKEVVREDGAISSDTDGQYHIEESTGIPDLEAGSDTPTGDSPVKMEDLESEAEFSKVSMDCVDVINQFPLVFPLVFQEVIIYLVILLSKNFVT